MKNNSITARSPNIGFRYQDLVALYFLIKNHNIIYKVAIEVEDDISFYDTNDNLIYVVQVKHTEQCEKNIKFNNKDFKKTILNWMLKFNEYKNNKINIPDFIFISPYTFQNDIFDYDKKRRHIDEVFINDFFKMFKENEYNFDNENSKIEFLDHIYTLTVGNIHEIKNSISEVSSGLIIHNIETQNIEKLIDFWCNLCLEYLKKSEKICIDKLHDVITNINNANKDKYTIDKEIKDYNGDNIYIQQLKLINCNEDEIKIAEDDNLIAFGNRLKWISMGLDPEELTNYDNRLYDDWNHKRYSAYRKHTKDEDKGYQLYKDCIIKYNADISKLDYIDDGLSNILLRGSFHMLADDEKIGWHPFYKEELRKNDN
ncbi:ABC-three component system protein [Brachyspira pilosicoli]|uniref:ABC-three component system protein n=1 Tax=Brachyspira pilosicoli TaxID=52584 RepID=UPI0012F4E717|nr:ABC-three component system protein [Brachyspira pilosicoli]